MSKEKSSEIAQPITVSDYWQIIRQACVGYRKSDKSKPRIVSTG